MDEKIRNEKKCIESVQSGNKEAYSIVVNTYKKRAYFIAYSFVKAFRHIKKFDTGCDFFPWFYRILKNLCLDWLRKNKRRSEIPLEDVTIATTPHLNEMLRIEMWEGIEKLPMVQREILTLRYFQGFSYREIAETLNKPLGSVMSSLYYSKKNLRAKMGGVFNEARRN